jgi:hypothetical protein
VNILFLFIEFEIIKMPPKKVEAKKAAAVNVTLKKLIHL